VSLRVVDGSGGLDHPVAARARAVTPAWRPGGGYVLTYATTAGGLRTVDADSGRLLWRSRDGAPLELAWTRDGRRLLALTRTALVVYSRDGVLIARRELPAGAHALAVAPNPDGRRAAFSFTRRGVSSVVSLRLDAVRGRSAPIFTGSGTFRELAWSPSGRRLLVGWPEANQWLLIGDGRPRAFAGMSRQLDPGGAGAGFPRIVGWCCR
jgi:dipeptidyl aminopeptidase/acylaminoacyl peptidase